MRVVIVCTANQCRSPMAEAFLARALGPDSDVISVGTRANGGVAATTDTVTVMALRGYNVSNHLARSVDSDLLRRADLVLAMEAAHIRECVEVAPDSFPRLFTLREFVGLVAGRGSRRSGESLAAYLGRLHEGRDIGDTLRRSAIYDVPDPIGRGRDEYIRTAGELEELCDRIADAIRSR